MSNTVTVASQSSARHITALTLAAAVGVFLIGWGDDAWGAIFAALGLDTREQIPGAIHFFLFELGKIFALITMIVFAVGVMSTWLTPDKVQSVLAKLPRGVGNIAAAGIGVATPFCSCSAVPLYVGFTRAGVPVGVGMSFLIASPMVNEIALGVLAAVAGWQIALLYLGIGVTIAVASGIVLGLIFDAPRTPPRTMLNLAMPTARPTLVDRLAAGQREVRTTLKSMWPWIIAALAIGSVVHGWVPADALESIGSQPWGVLAAVALGVPLYSGAASALPLISPLYDAGVPLGTLLAFLMSVVALSVPEMLLLRKVMKPRVLASFVGIVALSIIGVGYLLNAVM